MSAVHLHLLVNHIPILGTGFCLLLLIAALVRRSQDLMGAALVGLAVVGVAAAPTYFSGEKAETSVKPLPEVSNVIMEEHEEAALYAALTAGGVGALALGTLLAFRGGRPRPGWLTAVLVIGTVLSMAMMVRTGNLGGKVRHSEIR